MVAHPKAFYRNPRLVQRTKNPRADFLSFSAAQSFELIRWSIYSASAGCQQISQPFRGALPLAFQRLSLNAVEKLSKSRDRARIIFNFFHFFLREVPTQPAGRAEPVQPAPSPAGPDLNYPDCRAIRLHSYSIVPN